MTVRCLTVVGCHGARRLASRLTPGRAVGLLAGALALLALLGGCATSGCAEHARSLRERHTQFVVWCEGGK